MGQYVLSEAHKQTPITISPFHVSNLPDGQPWTEFYRTSAGILLRFPKLADFEVSADGALISSRPAPGIPDATVEHLYLNQVLPLALSKAGKLVLHASAVELDSGAVAFLAEAGRGKSTLAAAFATNGWRFLTDDGLVLDPKDNGYLAMPSHPSIRLWRDSHERFLTADAPAAPPISYSSKARLLADSDLKYCNEPRSLRALYCLGCGTASSVSIERLSAAESLVQLAKHAFLLDIEDRKLINTHFDRLADLAERIPCFDLDYPREFSELPGVRRAVVGHAMEAELS